MKRFIIATALLLIGTVCAFATYQALEVDGIRVFIDGISF